jgi:hypothetical protein
MITTALLGGHAGVETSGSLMIMGAGGDGREKRGREQRGEQGGGTHPDEGRSRVTVVPLAVRGLDSRRAARDCYRR